MNALRLLYVACAVLSVLLLMAHPLIVLGAVIGLTCLYVAYRYPYQGLLLYLIIEYSRPGDIWPVVADLHPARAMAVTTAVGWVVARSRDWREKLVLAPQTWMVVGIVATMVISVTTAVWRGQAVQITMEASKVAAVYFLMTNLLTTRRRLSRVIWVLTGLGFALACRSMMMYLRTGSFSSGPGAGFLGDRNDLALGMVVLMPLAGSLFQASTRMLHRLAAGTAFAALIGGLVCTFSRGGFLGLVVVLLATAMMARRRVMATIALTALFVVAWLLAPASYQTRIISIGDYRRDESAMSRISAWHSARMMFRDRPLFGVGPGNFQTAYGKLYRPSGTPTIWRAPHSIYFECIAELGVFGSFFFGSLVYLTYRDLLRIYRRRVPFKVPEWERRVASGIAVALTGYLAGAAFLSALRYPHPYYLAALTVSLVVGMRRASLASGGEPT